MKPEVINVFFESDIELAVIKDLSLWERSTLIKIFRRWCLALYKWFHSKQVTSQSKILQPFFCLQHSVSFKLLITKPMEKSNNEVTITSNAAHTGRAFNLKKLCMFFFFFF